MPIPKYGHEPMQLKTNSSASNGGHLGEGKVWCQFCGLDTKLHDGLGPSQTEHNPEIFTTIPEIDQKMLSDDSVMHVGSRCSILAPELQVTKLPLVEATPFVLLSKQEQSGALVTLSNRDILAVAEPSIILSICELTRHWKLHTFCHSEPSADLGDPFFPLDVLGRNKIEVENHLAPCALLAVITEQFIRALVRRGLEVADRDKFRAVSTLPSRSKGKHEVNGDRILTPTHILSGILSRGLGRNVKRNPLDSIILCSLSKLGVVVGDDNLATDRGGKSSL